MSHSCPRFALLVRVNVVAACARWSAPCGPRLGGRHGQQRQMEHEHSSGRGARNSTRQPRNKSKKWGVFTVHRQAQSPPDNRQRSMRSRHLGSSV
eukprot:5003869-Prymnesium_polylepis.1